MSLDSDNRLFGAEDDCPMCHPKGRGLLCVEHEDTDFEPDCDAMGEGK